MERFLVQDFYVESDLDTPISSPQRELGQARRSRAASCDCAGEQIATWTVFKGTRGGRIE
jgi:hypothetical protein